MFGTDYAITKTLAFEARWDRRRLDRAIEDTAIFCPDGSETFLIVNPGFGPNAVNLAAFLHPGSTRLPTQHQSGAQL